MFLKELKYSKHYENIHLIHYELTGKEPDNISHLEEILLEEFKMILDAYDQKFKKKINRVNFISTHYVFYQLLKKHKHPCKKEDFIILKNIDRKTFHDEICSEIFEYLGFTFTPIA
jgi:hypothetical protein